MKQRSHFMPPTLLRSQLDTLEEPSQEESAIVLDITLPIEQVALAVITAIQQREAVGQ
jgi:gluconate kinase